MAGSSLVNTHDTQETLLPPHLARVVTSVSLATRISLRCSSLVVGTFFEAAKYGTSVSLGLSRNALMNAISTARNIPREQEDGLFVKSLEKYTNASLDFVSHTFSLAELFALSSLQFTSRTIQSGLKAADESVRVLDGIFGSNETSCAIAYIITRISKEFMHDPDFDLAKAGKMAILTGLTKALTAFALLQNVTHRRRTIPCTLLWESMNEPSEMLSPMAHYIKYASAAYGENFMRILGIGDIPAQLPTSHPPNHHAFAHHTQNSIDDILLSSYTDPSPFLQSSLKALVHYVTVDHSAQAIVLTCRGTLGLSDLLTDLSFDYTEFRAWGSTYSAHRGMLKAAQRLAIEKGPVFSSIRQGLERYPAYGLILCGHSLGGGVASLLTVLWSQDGRISSDSGLPANRPLHCYAYGPPGVMCLALSQRCRGLVTSVVHGYDIVSSLSLGLLHDFKNLARSLHAERNVAEEIMARVIQQRMEGDEDDPWLWAMIKTMRADMTAEKMYPAGIVYWIEQAPEKIKVSQCDDVQARFSEVLFSKSMFMDHSPYLYEKAIEGLSIKKVPIHRLLT
ncbi:Alpha/Beta hydrolase protein [Sporodiniella umbellata]|nr:Alpha/Beta hydrolase protein [Sporodiniella umbellata]